MVTSFFQKDDILPLISKTITTIYDSSDTPTPIFIQLLIQMLQKVYDNPNSFDEFCQDTIAEYKTRIPNALIKICNGESSQKYKILLFEFFHRLMCEHAFRSRYSHQQDSSFSIRSDIIKNLTNLPIELHPEILYDNHAMPALWVNKILTSENFKKAEKFLSRTDEFDNFIRTSGASLDHQIEKVNALKDELNSYQVGFNFVGLYKGFHDLKEQKIKSLKSTKLGLYFLGLCLLLSVALSFYYAPDFDSTKIPRIISAIGFDVLLAYYFKIFLSNFNKTKEELSAIDLRMTLCQFIQSYAEFAKEINAQSPSTLEKFDTLIFSSLESTINNQASTNFDGVDQITKLVEIIKQK